MLTRLPPYLGICLALLMLTACKQADPLADLQTGEQGRVVRVIDGDALILDTGQSIRLIGIEAPARPYQEREGEPFHEESRRALEDLSLGRMVQVKYAGLTRDRYDRALAHVQTTDNLGPPYWLNQEMIRRGAARVRVYPDTATANAPLLTEEEAARVSKKGLWALAAYRVPSAAHLPPDFSRFQLVHATLEARVSSDTPRVSCLWTLRNSALTLAIKRDAAALCQAAPNSNVLARGYVKDAQMEITHPLNLQISSE